MTIILLLLVLLLTMSSPLYRFNPIWSTLLSVLLSLLAFLSSLVLTGFNDTTPLLTGSNLNYLYLVVEQTHLTLSELFLNNLLHPKHLFLCYPPLPLVHHHPNTTLPLLSHQSISANVLTMGMSIVSGSIQMALLASTLPLHLPHLSMTIHPLLKLPTHHHHLTLMIHLIHMILSWNIYLQNITTTSMFSHHRMSQTYLHTICMISTLILKMAKLHCLAQFTPSPKMNASLSLNTLKRTLTKASSVIPPHLLHHLSSLLYCKGIIIFSITTLTVYLFSLNKNMFCIIFFYVTGVTSVPEFYTFFIQFSWTFLNYSWIISEFLCIIYTALISCLFNFDVTLISFGQCHNIKILD